MDAGTKQVAELGDVEVSVDRPPAANLEVVHAQFLLGLLKTALDRPTGKAHPQEPFQRHAEFPWELVGHEVIDLVSVQRVAGRDQVRSQSGAIATTPSLRTEPASKFAAAGSASAC